MPTSPTPLHPLSLEQACAFHQTGKIEQARAMYRELLEVQPRNADILGLLGTAECQLGRLADGVKLFEKSLEFNPKQPKVYLNLGAALLRLQQCEDALTCYDKALAILPGFAEACFGRANALKDLARLEEAVAGYDQALAIKPDFVEAHNNRGNALKELQHREEALSSYAKALALRPNYAEACFNMGNTLRELRRYEEALACFHKALTIRPGYVEAQWHKAMLLILLGDYAKGWHLYESRWKRGGTMAVRPFKEPCWLGDEDLKGKTLLIHPEQGLGDYLQFCRYALMAQDLGAKVVLEAPRPLASVISTMSQTFTVVPEGEALPPFDYQCPVMSLPLAFRTQLETIPSPIPYLHANPELVSEWQERLGPKRRPRIGLFWAGNLTNKQRAERSIPLSMLEPMLNLPLEFHSLQKELPPEEEAQLLEHPSINMHQGCSKDFPNTAALMEAMDLIISVDSSITHLAGAMGKPLWVLLPYLSDFRWMRERLDSPWYPTARLFRQSERGNWPGVIQNVSTALMQDVCN